MHITVGLGIRQWRIAHVLGRTVVVEELCAKHFAKARKVDLNKRRTSDVAIDTLVENNIERRRRTPKVCSSSGGKKEQRRKRYAEQGKCPVPVANRRKGLPFDRHGSKMVQTLCQCLLHLGLLTLVETPSQKPKKFLPSLKLL